MPQLVKNEVPTMWETWVRFLGWEDSPEKGNGNLLQYSGQENSMDCIVHGVAKSWIYNPSYLHFILFMNSIFGVINLNRNVI